MAATIIDNAGTILGENEYAIRIAGDFNNSITNHATGQIYGNGGASIGSAVQLGGGNDKILNSGSISGTNGLAVSMGGGDDEFVWLTGGFVNGLIDGGAGNNTLRFDSTSVVILNQNNLVTNFNTTIIEQGKVEGTADARLGNVQIASGASLAGALTVGQISGAGSVDPGFSPGILTAHSIDPTGGMDFNFEFTGFDPVFNMPAASVNDIIRLTNAAPFTASMTGGNAISIFFDVAGINDGDIFKGGFFTDTAADFLSSFSGASFQYYIADAGGSTIYLSKNYSALDMSLWNVSLGTVAQSADFGAGAVNGQIAQFTIQAVPEPSTYALMGLGAAAFLLLARRKLRRNA